MSILKWKNFDDMLSVRDEVDRLFDKMFQKTSFQSWEERYALVSSGESAPEFNMSQSDEGIVIQVTLPGFEMGDVKVSVSGNLLAIGSEVSREREFRGTGAYRYHRSRGSFCKFMELPAGVDGNNIRTSFENGVLEVVLPKARPDVTHENETDAPTDTSLALPWDLPPDEIDEI